MKILILSQYFWPENFKINNLSEYLSRRHDVEILTSIPNYPHGYILKNFAKNPNKFDFYKKMKIYRAPQITRGKGSIIRIFFNYMSFFITSFITSFFLKKKYDLIFVFATSPIFVALIGIFISRLNKSKTIIWVLDLWPEILKELKIIKSLLIIKIIKKIVKYIYLKSDIILAQSNSFRKTIQTELPKNQKHKVFFFPSWADDIKIIHKKPLLKKNFLSILYVGNIGQAQNLENLVFATQLIKSHVNLKWTIIGDGRKKDSFINLINKYELQKYFSILPFKSHKHLHKNFYLSDCCYLSLQKGKILNSTIPAKLQTYMKLGKPILASIGGEVKNIIEKANCGLVSAPNNHIHLAKNIKYFAKMSNAKLNKFGMNSKLFYKNNFAQEKTLRNLDFIIKNYI
jgi:colanic acid biosynthesis glycosyl transferase WcaI